MIDFEKIVAVCVPILIAVAIIIAGAILVKVILKIADKALNKTNVDEALHSFIKNIIKVALWLLIIVTALGKLGIPTTTFVTAIGACGAAIALALKDSLSNVAGGVLILLKKPFGKGDFIEVAGSKGSVDKIDLLATTLITVDNKVVSIPNGAISNSVLTNYSAQDKRRVDNVFGIGYECDIDKAREVLFTVIEANEKILKTPEAVVLVDSHGDNSVNLQTRVWCDTADYWPVYYYMQEQVKKAFDVAEINIPYPQVDLHVIKN